RRDRRTRRVYAPDVPLSSHQVAEDPFPVEVFVADEAGECRRSGGAPGAFDVVPQLVRGESRVALQALEPTHLARGAGRAVVGPRRRPVRGRTVDGLARLRPAVFVL